MAAKRKKKCGLAGCKTVLGPGSGTVGFDRHGKTTEVDVCSEHLMTIVRAPRGTWHITPNFELKAVPAKPIIFT